MNILGASIPLEILYILGTLASTVIVNRLGYSIPGQPTGPSKAPNGPPVTPSPTVPVSPVPVAPSPLPVVNTGHPILDGVANAVPFTKEQFSHFLLSSLQDLLVPKADPVQQLRDHLGQLLVNTANPNPPTAPVVAPAVQK